MVSVTLENGEEHEYDRVSIEQGVVLAYEVGEDAPEGMADVGEVRAVFPDSSVLKVEVGEDEYLVESIKDRQADEYTVKSR